MKKSFQVSQFAETRMNFMKKINYPWWIFFLSLMTTLAPWKPLSATIKQFTDETGKIHINNTADDNNKAMNKDYKGSVQNKKKEPTKPPDPAKPSEVVKPPEAAKPGDAAKPEPKPLNLSPTPEQAEKEEEEPPDEEED